MALSNIFVEPKREIAESLVGIVIVLIPSIAWYLISSYLAGVTWDSNHIKGGNLSVCPYPLWVALNMCFTLIVVFLAWIISTGFLIFTHFIGEIVCDSLQYKDINLRPKNRYKRNWKGIIERTN